jgi:hypothetical protein
VCEPEPVRYRRIKTRWKYGGGAAAQGDVRAICRGSDAVASLLMMMLFSAIKVPQGNEVTSDGRLRDRGLLKRHGSLGEDTPVER